MSPMDFGAAIVSAGIGFVLADGLDRFLATYNPAAPPPTDKFTSQGVGTLANTLNIAAPPHWQRLAALAGSTAAPAIGSMYVKNGLLKSSLEGAAIGSGVKLFQLLWNNVLMPMIAPKTPSALQASKIARLYPAEVSASLNVKSANTAAAAGTSFGALSGNADVGPFALNGSSPYPDAAQALRTAAGVQGPGGTDYPSLQNTWGTGRGPIPGWPGVGRDYATAAQAMGTGGPSPEGSQYMPGPPPGPGPGPQANPHESCGCIGDDARFAAFLGDAEEKDTLFIS